MMKTAPLFALLSPALAVGPYGGAFDTHRKLETTQEKIQALVDDAMNSGVNGMAIAIDYVYLSTNQQQLTVGVSVPGADSVQRLLIDTGSSTLAFCDSSLASTSEQQSLLLPEYGQCNSYSDIQQCTGSGDPVSFKYATCNVNNSITKFEVVDNTCSGYDVWWVGSVFQGNMSVYGGNSGKEVALVENITYSIIDEQQFYACDKPLDGIFGVAFGSLNEVDILPSGITSSDLIDSLCDTAEEPNPGIATCRSRNNTKTLTPPLQQALYQSVDEGIDIQATFGLYVDYWETWGAHADQPIPGLGIFYGGNMAKNNSHYNGGTPQIASNGSQTALASPYGNKPLWWILVVKDIRIGEESSMKYSYPESFCLGDNLGNCIADSGNSWLMLPIPEEVCEKGFAQFGGAGKVLSIDLEGQEGGTITLQFPLDFLVREGNWIQCTGTDGTFVLGMPTFQIYYLVYDMNDATVTFVDLPQDGYDYTSGSESHFGVSVPLLVVTMIFSWMLTLW